MPVPCLSSIAFAVASAASAFRSTQTMCAPSLTSRWATSLPMPLPAPMTTMTWRASSFSGRHALELRLLEQPVFDVEGFLLRQGDVFVDRLGAAHDFDGAVVELGGDARLALVLAPGDHAEAGNEDDGRVRVAHGRRIGVLAAVVIGAVILAVLGEAVGEHALEPIDVAAGRVPVDVERLDLGAQEMVGATGAEFGEPGGVVAVDEAQDRGVVLHRADDPLRCR